jgi:membrane-associated phospholipid phosphatase
MRNGLKGPLFGAAACAAGLASLILAVYHDGGAQRLDATALYGFGKLNSGVLCAAASGFVQLGSVLAVVLALVALCGLAVRWGRRREAIAAVAVVLAASVTTQILKVVLAHPRVQPILGTNQISAASFPSGHATAAMAMAVAWLLVVPPRWRATTAVAGAVLVFGVSFSVLVLTWHFPSDALAGILVATGYGFAALAALRYLEAPPREHRMTTMIPSPLPRTTLEAAATAIVLGAAVLAFARAGKIVDYAGTYTTTVLAALAISAVAASLLALFTLTASD